MESDLAQAYPELFTPKIDPIEVAADFYLLELALVLGATEAEPLQGALLQNVSPTFYWFLHYAIGRELRYSSAMTGPGGPMSGIDCVSRSSSRSQAAIIWRSIFERDGIAALDLARSLFSSMEKSLLGGVAWVSCVDLLLQHESRLIDQKVFLDRLFGLEHNTGSLLNKRSWANNRKGRSPETWILPGVQPHEFNVSNQEKGLKALLDCRCGGNPNVKGLYSCSSSEIRMWVKSQNQLTAWLD